LLLPNRVVDVWPIHLEATDAELEGFRQVLTPEELAKASRFHFESLRRFSIVGRGALRFLLGTYTGIGAAAVRFRFGPKGKPMLAKSAPVKFNLAHSGEIALVGVTLDCEIGVDVERVRAIDDMKQIAHHFFCLEEANELMTLRPIEREAAFFRCWTRKEAFIKATGEGLNEPLDRVQVTLLPGLPARFIKVNNNIQAAEEWTLHDIQAVPKYVGALAYRDARRPLRIRPLINAGELLRMVGHC
jgi:4'-phosphopantetheinyl transferase